MLSNFDLAVFTRSPSTVARWCGTEKAKQLIKSSQTRPKEAKLENYCGDWD
jgi:hypothetical protein